MMSEIILEPTVTISNEKDRERAERVLQNQLFKRLILKK